MTNNRISIEQCLADVENRKFCERLACKGIKAGAKFPDGDEVIRVLDALTAKDPTELSLLEMEIVMSIRQGLIFLAQLCLAHERM